MKRHTITAALGLAACSTMAVAGSAGASAPPGSAPVGTDGAGDVTVVTVEVTAAGCALAEASYDSGAFTFEVTNVDATAVTEFEIVSGDRILGEKENLPAGFSGTFSLNLGPGDYETYCPGAETERTAFTVTGDELVAAPTDNAAVLQQGAAGYLGYVQTQLDEMVEAVAVLDEAVQSGDLEASKLAYIGARPFYERIEPVAESFVAADGTNLDAAIDLRADDVEPTELTGFHRIEYGLWIDETTDGLADISTQLVADIASLHELVDGLEGFQPAELANGAVGLLDEAAKGKITGEEERYSRIDVVDMAANVEGAEQAFAYLEEGLTAIDAELVTAIKDRFDALDAAVAELADPAQPSGYVLYDALTDEQITALSQALQAVAEPLSQVAAKVL